VGKKIKKILETTFSILLDNKTDEIDVYEIIHP
jgi:hypothetical protein